jgi:hypothetical protein
MSEKVKTVGTVKKVWPTIPMQDCVGTKPLRENMSEHNPFDAAIDVLEGIVNEHEQAVGWKDDVQDWKDAIRVLEAAGKMDKDDLRYVLERWLPPSIRALLESLPDEKEEEKK